MNNSAIQADMAIKVGPIAPLSTVVLDPQIALPNQFDHITTLANVSDLSTKSSLILSLDQDLVPTMTIHSIIYFKCVHDLLPVLSLTPVEISYDQFGVRLHGFISPGINDLVLNIFASV